MKYPCNLVRDLLPLYLDSVCSAESREIVEKHLESCPECAAYFKSMTEANQEVNVPLPSNAKNECQKASSLRAVKKRIVRKQILTAMAVLAVIFVLTLSVIGILKKSTRVVPYKNNLSVSMVDGSLIGRLYGSEYFNVKIKTIAVNHDGQEQRWAFYCVADTAWNDLVTSDNVFSEYVLCPQEKGADTIDRVYYYTGEYTGLESMNEEEIKAVIQNAELLWEKP